ncbi:MAG: lycopene cyclase family protein [Winogradskyella sp.]
MKSYDYIILGAGASGLMLAYRLALDPYFDDKTVLIIDKVKDKGNDRTWCYWENGKGEWDNILTKVWPNIIFGSNTHLKTFDITPYQYKMIRSENFYNSLWKTINEKPNFKFVEDDVESFKDEDDSVVVNSDHTKYIGKKLFNSIPDPEVYYSQNKYPVIQQHFVGWFVKTKTDIFDDNTATFMDFTIPQKGNTRFMYVLPLDKKTALFEYTLFSKDFLEISEYEEAIKSYLKDKGIEDYEIVEKEKGAIPMTSFKFAKLNSKNILNIGTAGGWTKASTGYSFNNTTKKTKSLIRFLKSENDLSKFYKTSKFELYDLIFLDVLANYNEKGSAIFSSMFEKVNVKTILKFLDEETSIPEDLKIILSVPPRRFMQSLLKRTF